MKDMVGQHFRPRRPQNCQLLGDIKKMHLSVAMKHFFPHVSPQPCAIYNPTIEINSCHSYHSHPDHCRDTNHLSHVHASDEDQMRDATQSPQLVLGPKLLAKAAKSSQLALDFDVDFPQDADSGCCWSLRNSCNWYQYNWCNDPFILSCILRKKCLGAFEPVWMKLSMIVPLNHSAA